MYITYICVSLICGLEHDFQTAAAQLPCAMAINWMVQRRKAHIQQVPANPREHTGFEILPQYQETMDGCRFLLQDTGGSSLGEGY